MPFCVYILLLVFTYLYVFISMACRGTAVAPVLTAFGHGCSACMIWCVGACVGDVFYSLCLHALFILQSNNSSSS